MTDASLTQLLHHPAGATVAVLGLGVSGGAMAALLRQRGAQVLGLDDRVLPKERAAVLRALGVKLMAPPVKPAALAGCAALALSPGVDARHHPLAQHARTVGLPLFGELELCSPLPCPAVGITGTNGKSTTTALCGALFASLGRRTFCGGNLGDPLSAWLSRGERSEVAAIELSSYQLERTRGFAPEVGVVLGVTPDHLERYASFADYVDAKANLVRAVPPQGTVILNADDAHCRAMAPLCRGQVLYFSTQPEVDLPGAGLRLGADDKLEGHGPLRAFADASLTHARLLGLHNRHNAMAAFLAAFALGLAPRASVLLPGYHAFAGLPHRLQWVGACAGVEFIDDSKATNDAAAAIAIRAMHRPAVVLLGGQDKGGGYAAVVLALRASPPRAVLCFGQAAPTIAAALAQAGLASMVHRAAPEACPLPLEQARRLAQPGDVVLLSPACASFDSFADYRARGICFAQWVQAHADKAKVPA